MRRIFGMALISVFAAFLSACNVKQIAAGYVGRVLTPTGWEDRIYEAGQMDLGTKHFSGTYNTLVLLEASSTTVKEQFTSAAILTDPNCRRGRGIPLFQILGSFGSVLKLVWSSNAMATHQIWFITGSSRGFGWALASAVLEAGDSVVATARRPEQLTLLVEQYGQRVLPVALDVTNGAAAQAAVEAAVNRFGRIDVLVNNAGYANIAPVETASEEDFRRQFETNFWGVYNVSKAALPVLKRQGSGTIVQFSSIGGRVGGTAGLGSYQAAKFAVDGFTRVLATETAPFGIRCLTVEPGGFATDWAGASMEIQGIPAEYDGTVGATARLLKSDVAKAGDPKRAGEILVRVVKRQHLPTHLLLGVGAVHLARDYSRRQIAEDEVWREVSISADFGQRYPVDLPNGV